MFNIGGGMLTGQEIEKQIKKGRISIDPFNPSRINPNSYNLTLDDTLKMYTHQEQKLEQKEEVKPKKIDLTPTRYAPGPLLCEINDDRTPLDMNKNNSVVKVRIPETGYTLKPGILYLGQTVEKCGTDYYIPMINGRSSVGRLGMSIHITAGFGDIGFNGTWTLEITVVEPLIVYPGAEIAQVCYFTPSGKTGMLYTGRYSGQTEVTPSRFYLPKKGLDNNDKV